MRILLCLFASFFISASLVSIPAVVPDNIPCFVELEKTFFEESVVNQALSLYKVRQELWLPINSILKQKNGEVPSRLKNLTAYMVPNPLEYPMQRRVVGKLLKEVLFDVFFESVQQYVPMKKEAAVLAFDYIFSQQSLKFARCFGNE